MHHNPFCSRPYAACLLAACVGVLSPLLSTPATAAETAWAKWISALQSQGFTVTQGAAAAFGCQDLVSVFKDCGGNNPAGSYVELRVPVDNEYVDPCYNAAHDCGLSGQNIFTKPVLLPSGGQAAANMFYRMSDTQALVVILRLPPSAAYFGYQNYVWTRARSTYGQECAPQSPSDKNPNPCRVLVRADVGNSINHLAIRNQSGLTLGSGGTVAFITTSNSALYDSLSTIFGQSGGDPRLLFLEPLASKVAAGKYTVPIVTGLGAEADELNALVRYSVPQDQAAADGWTNAIADNIRVFRIGKAEHAVSSFSTVRIARKNYTAGETNYQAAVDELASILQGWLQSTTSVPVRKIAMNVSPAYSSAGQPVSGAVGPICLQNQSDCISPTSDTDTYRSALIGKLSGTAVMVGVDSTQTGNANYVGVGINRADILEGIYSLVQTNAAIVGFASGTLSGSASDLVASLVSRQLIPSPSSTLLEALPKLYVAIATRDCAAASTNFICTKKYTVKVEKSGIPTNTQVVLSRRAYIHPGDLNGTNPLYLVNPVVIK